MKVSLLNFTITIKGLEEQLLNTAVKEELPDLAQKKVRTSFRDYETDVLFPKKQGYANCCLFFLPRLSPSHGWFVET